MHAKKARLSLRQDTLPKSEGSSQTDSGSWVRVESTNPSIDTKQSKN